MSKEKEVFEKIYKKAKAGWTKNKPPKELSELVKKKKVAPCKAIDIGCGEGHYSIYLASKGFDVVGIDLCPRAIASAEENAKKAGVKVRFIEGDVTSALKLEEDFDFVLEWSLLHHIMPNEREDYINNVAKLLNKGGKYLSTCFHEKSLTAKSASKFQFTPVGTKVYYSSEAELTGLFEPSFKIDKTKLFTFEAPPGVKHTYNYFFMEKL